MNDALIDTNVVVRYLVEDPATIDPKFSGVYGFFRKIEEGILRVRLPELVLFRTYFVLTSYYRVPRQTAARKLGRLIAFRGFIMPDRPVATACLRCLQEHNLDLVDAYLLAWQQVKGTSGVYSFDAELRKKGLSLLPVG